jgi:hypothetical protein
LTSVWSNDTNVSFKVTLDWDFRMAKPRIVTELQLWMLETGRTDVSLASEMNARLPKHRNITERAVGRWRKGLTLPRYPELVVLLTKLSEGRVTADCFISARMNEMAHSANARETWMLKSDIA